MAEELSRLRKKRSANKNVVLGLVTKTETRMGEGSDIDVVTDVRANLQLIKGKIDAPYRGIK